MTISYSDRFWKLFFRWKGSLWKTLYKELAAYLFVYYCINLLYRFVLKDTTKRKFEAVAFLFDAYSKQIPLTFLLGFYVGMVVKRWWEQFIYISWPDTLMYWVSAYIKGQSEDAKTIRRAIARYCILSAVLAWRSISIRVLKRFPTEQHIVDCGLMTEEEFQLYSKHEVLRDPHKRWFIPLNWVQTIFVKCQEQKRLSHPNELRTLLEELKRYRQGFMKLFLYDWVSIPLVYTQVATIVTYAYFTLLLISRQVTEKFRGHAGADSEVDLYVPVFTILQFLFYVGWLKVGEDLMNPFGEDDEDFEFNYLLDRHLEIAFLIVDKLHGEVAPLYPESNTLCCDKAGIKSTLPHTKASEIIENHPPIRHFQGEFTPEDMEFVAQKQPTTSRDSIIVRPKSTVINFSHPLNGDVFGRHRHNLNSSSDLDHNDFRLTEERSGGCLGTLRPPRLIQKTRSLSKLSDVVIN